MKCFISKSVNPFLNLAFEDWYQKLTNDRLLRNTKVNHTLFLWRNSPCVVLGRNQNPWKEINFQALKDNNVPLVRRNSGGGTVYHDLGNTNYCHIMPRDEFERNISVTLISQALHELDIPSNVNHRYDIVIDEKKVSGSAYKLISDRAYHHGTMLIDTDLDILNTYLNPKKKELVGLGTDSVRSTVTRLREHSFTVDHSSFCEAVQNEFEYKYGDLETIVLDESSMIDTVKTTFENLQKHDWIIGQTPKFTLGIKNTFTWGDLDFILHVHKGTIVDLIFTTDTIGIQPILSKTLVGNSLMDISILTSDDEKVSHVLKYIETLL
ncbi:lipoate-protein ligase A [Globomyces pollinis-pini]|nr:lipoate-protein ligase A [Globomyces pollinis-pini]